MPGDYKDLRPNNPDIRVEEGTLLLNNIQKSSEGYYMCEAVNNIGSGLSAVVMISVQGNDFATNRRFYVVGRNGMGWEASTIVCFSAANFRDEIPKPDRSAR